MPAPPKTAPAAARTELASLAFVTCMVLASLAQHPLGSEWLRNYNLQEISKKNITEQQLTFRHVFETQEEMPEKTLT